MPEPKLAAVLTHGVRIAAETGSPYCAPEHALAGLAQVSGPALASVLGTIATADMAQAAQAAAEKLNPPAPPEAGQREVEIPVSISLYQAAGRGEGMRTLVDCRSDDLLAVIDLAALLLDDLTRSRVNRQMRASDLDVVLRSALDHIRAAI